MVIDTFGVVLYINPLFLIKVSVNGISVFSEKLFEVTFVAETSNSTIGVEQDKLIDEFSRLLEEFTFGNTDKW